MVSRQETARPLLTQGEVMQLPPADELVLVSGMAPIRAKKLRYFKDRNFRARLAPPPALGDGDYPDCPQERSEERRAGKECVSPVRSRLLPDNTSNNITISR